LVSLSVCGRVEIACPILDRKLAAVDLSEAKRDRLLLAEQALLGAGDLGTALAELQGRVGLGRGGGRERSVGPGGCGSGRGRREGRRRGARLSDESPLRTGVLGRRCGRALFIARLRGGASAVSRLGAEVRRARRDRARPGSTTAHEMRAPVQESHGHDRRRRGDERRHHCRHQDLHVRLPTPARATPVAVV
jgi:hypothetical protein